MGTAGGATGPGGVFATKTPGHQKEDGAGSLVSDGLKAPAGRTAS